MKRFVIVVALICLLSNKLYANIVTSESLFLNIPYTPQLDLPWFLLTSDTGAAGFAHPADIDVLKISPSDYRIVILDTQPPFFFTFRLNQSTALWYQDVSFSGELPDENGFPSAMCHMSTNEYFNPETDSIAVVFKGIPHIGIYTFNRWTNSFALVDSVVNQTISAANGVFWAFGDFFITEEDNNRLYRIDRTGSILFTYGSDEDVVGYKYIADINGYVDIGGTAHLFVGEGQNSRIEHLTATASNDSIFFKSWGWPLDGDELGMQVTDVAYLPNAGLFGFNLALQRMYRWDDPDSLYYTGRSDQDFYNDYSSLIHLRPLLGRLIAISNDTTGWTIRSLIPTGATVDDPLSYNDTLWTSAMSPIYVTDSIRIGAGDTLTISAGVAVKFDANTAIIVDSGGTLRVNGSVTNRVTMDNMNVGETWHGITVNGGSLSMSYVDMVDCESGCVVTNAPADIIITNSTFDGGNMPQNSAVLLLQNSPATTQVVKNSVVTNVPLAWGLSTNNASVTLENVTIEECGKANTLFTTTTGNITGCTFKDPPEKYGVYFLGAGTTPNFQCTEFDNICPTAWLTKASVYASTGTAPTFGFEGVSGGVSNVFRDSSDYIMRMYGSGVLPLVDNPSGSGAGGYNDWIQNKATGKYIYWGSPYSNPLNKYSANQQYWNKSPVNIGDFYPSDLNFYKISDPASIPYELCGSGESSSIEHGSGRRALTLDDLPTRFDTLFARAIALEVEGDYQAAQDSFRVIATSADSYPLVWQAITHVVSTQRYLNSETDAAWILLMVDSLTLADNSSYSTYVYGNRLKGTYNMARGAYAEAIYICTGLLGYGLSEMDSLLVSLDLLSIQMAAGLVDHGGGLDEVGNSVIPANLICASTASAMMRQIELLDALASLDSGSEPPHGSTLPTEFKLYQNYPNPFNPTTQIEFDLPEASNLSLKVFNTLGQEVATVSDGRFNAGHYVVTWNGKSNAGIDVATGLYIYQLKTGSFLDTKKMILMR